MIAGLPFSVPELLDEVEQGFVKERQCDDGTGRRLFNYTPMTQYSGRWNPVTLNCRGLILDESLKRVIARPFSKFFNLQELRARPEGFEVDGPVTAWAKMDGSLGIIHHHDGRWRVATRGSMQSPQSRAAEAMLPSLVDVSLLEERVTYLAEIIYPENRIVVDYGERRDLVFLAAVCRETGEEYLPGDPVAHPWGVRVAECRDFDSMAEFEELAQSMHDKKNFEGWVVTTACRQRLKYKLPVYVQVHRLLTLLSPRKVWEMLRAGEDTDAVFAQLPDEQYREAREIRADIQEQHASLLERHHLAYANLLARWDGTNVDRKGQAMAIKEMCAEKDLSPKLLFMLLDEKDPTDVAWKMVRPEAETPVFEVPE